MSAPGAARSGDLRLDGLSVVVMVKVPVAGRVKTRLAAEIGAVAAADLAGSFQRDLAMRLAAAGARTFWFWHPDAPCGADAYNLRQHGADLGERMADAIRRVASRHRAPVLVLGTDAPHVPLAWLAAAGAALQVGTDVALGPAEDGGYWTIGVRVPDDRLFADIAWGGPEVCRQTMARVRALGLSSYELPTTFDVDDAHGLARLRAAMAAGTVTLPATAGALAASLQG